MKKKACKIPITLNIPIEVNLGQKEIQTWIYNCNDINTLNSIIHCATRQVNELRDKHV